MIPHIPDQRKFKSNGGTPFNDLIAYIEGEQEQELGSGGEPERPRQQELSNQFDDILNYATAPVDKDTKAEKCIAIRTHGVDCLATASIEMNEVSSQNKRCKDPAYHIILSWPEHEHPAPELIFDAAEHAIKALGLAEHQYVIAVHGNTDNTHCHISVNRVHPITFKSTNIEWAVKTLHYAARESEIKHGWTHDNGIYVVETNGHGKKQIVLNKDHANALEKAAPRVHRDLGTEEILPTWHDPDSLDSWLKTRVARSLKHALPDLDSWQALHAWLGNYNIALSDSGGGGLRLHATSQDTGEILDVAASKGLRLLKRGDLEKRWGAFANSVVVPCIAPDLSHLTPDQIAEGVEDVINRTLDEGRPPEHIIRAQQSAGRAVPERGGSVHELPSGGVDSGGQDGDLQLPDPIQGGLGDDQARQDQNLRRTGTDPAGGRGEGGERSLRSQNRNDAQRAQRKAERASARADLRQRFAQYKRLVKGGDTDHFLRLKEAQEGRSGALKAIRDSSKAAKAAISKQTPFDTRLHTVIAINAESLRRKLQVEAEFQKTCRALRETRIPPFSWRAWLTEQANLGDQAALSALRGIVYQAQRDAKKSAGQGDDEPELQLDTSEARERQYRKVMARLLEEEKREAAIRSARSSSARPYEADALLARYVGIQWQVTGNGNVEYNDGRGHHLFTDRGSRVTFDRVRVSDDEIRLALSHAQQKFGKQLTLTGDDPVFTHRMARLADDMGMTVLNPDLRVVIERHRAARILEITQATTVQPARPAAGPTVTPEAVPARGPQDQPMPARAEPVVAAGDRVQVPLQPEIEPDKTPAERLRAMVLAIDPGAKFVVPDTEKSPVPFVGPIAAALDAPDVGFAQHVGRSVYAIHVTTVPEHAGDLQVEVNYRSGKAVVVVADGKGRGGTEL